MSSNARNTTLTCRAAASLLRAKAQCCGTRDTAPSPVIGCFSGTPDASFLKRRRRVAAGMTGMTGNPYAALRNLAGALVLGDAAREPRRPGR
ncbi:hypothetical protein [Roseicitreum antarcticum]|uniref:Uncharacterized protein n=1 Tax=Roseicitreum antarcticum TaxID=564137 RepID=A0A1H3C8B7_9RHOB|nr:hypothetical protein [Roseicitreum antarcticum]SDX50336.1 hypothetical protein SAMN04488238_10965 [Roseicitreum antarcticum]